MFSLMNSTKQIRNNNNYIKILLENCKRWDISPLIL